MALIGGLQKQETAPSGGGGAVAVSRLCAKDGDGRCVRRGRTRLPNRREPT